MVRTTGSQPVNPGSSPGGVTNSLLLRFFCFKISKVGINSGVAFFSSSHVGRFLKNTLNLPPCIGKVEYIYSVWYSSVMPSTRKLTQFHLPVEIFKDGRFFIARTPVLELSVQGKTVEIVRKRFVEAVVLFFEELEELGTTDEVLKELGWKKIKKQWNPPLTSVEISPVQVCVSV